MKNKNIIKISASALVGLAAIAGLSSAVMAADSGSTTIDSLRGFFGREARQNMTADQINQFEADREARRTAMDAAIESEDYSAFVSAVGQDDPILDRITEENFADYVQQHKDREAQRTAIQSAIEAGDYSAWVTAIGSDSPIASKINADNFGRYTEAQKLMGQAQGIMTELGIGGRGYGMGDGDGLGIMGEGHGGGHGRGMGMKSFNGASGSNN